jgi:hypothetical protein
MTENIVKLIQSKSTSEKSEELYNCISTPGKGEELASIFIRDWELANQLVTSQGGKFIAVLQPSVFSGTSRKDHLTLDEGLEKNFNFVYNSIRAELAEKEYNWSHDLTKVFDNNAEYIYIDFCHVSSNGNKVISESISKIVNQTQN